MKNGDGWWYGQPELPFAALKKARTGCGAAGQSVLPIHERLRPLRWQLFMDHTINAPIEQAAAALAHAAALPMTATDEQTLTLLWDLARIARHLGELTAAARDRWAAWGTVTPHLQQAEALAADTTRCLSHAAGTYAFNTTRLDPAIIRLAASGVST